MHGDLQRVLFDADAIATRVAELADEIAADLTRLAPAGEVLLVPVLMGSIIFVADLMRRLPHRIRIAVVSVVSYPGRSTMSQGPSLRGELPPDLAGRHVLLVDDILDSGRTLRLLRMEVVQRRPLSVRCCVLLRKSSAGAMSTPCEYVGFDIPDEFVVGYGLDYNDCYRNLPYIGTLKREAMR